MINLTSYSDNDGPTSVVGQVYTTLNRLRC